MSIHLAKPTFEHHRDALGIGESTPRISWVTNAEPGWRQEAYEIEIVRSGQTTHHGPVESSDSVLVAWPGEPLSSREIADVRVRVQGGRSWSEWSPPARVEAGLLNPWDWSALAVGPAWPEDANSDRRPPLVRRDFTLPGQAAAARLYVTAHGLYEVEINGQRVGDEALAPGWTPYASRLRYRTYDVTEHLRAGQNAIGAWLGDGWYRGRFGFDGGHRNLYGSRIALIAQLEVTLTDGERIVVGTDGEWTAGVGPIIFSELYNGETYDAREAVAGWSSAGFESSAFTPARALPHHTGVLDSWDGPPVRCTEEIPPVSITRVAADTHLVDFGQNFAGRLRIRVNGVRGHTVVLRHAEVLQDGRLCTRPLRFADATDSYTLAGGGDEYWEPRFTIHGFRYAEVTNWPGELTPADITGRVYHTDMRRTGWFECSNQLVNRLHENVVWSMRSNFVDVPTDCPARDERLGWTGDIQVFAPTASFLYDCAGMLTSWLKDVALEQLPDGTVPWYVPVIPGHPLWSPIQPGAAWGDVAVLTPWTLYEYFGDTGVLAEQYQSAKGWVDLMARLAGPTRLWNTGMQLGDWLDPAAPPDDPADALTDRYLVATAYFARSAEQLARTAKVLGFTEESRHYHELAAQVRSAFAAEYLTGEGRLTSDAQTAYALALEFDLIPDEPRRAAAGRRLAELVHLADNRIATGFVGTPLVCHALSNSGDAETAYDLLLEKECPSWLYTVTSGGTTMWERWDSLRPDGTLNPGEMTSFNHYALGAVADWMHRVIAGIAPKSPGYREIHFQPIPGGGITSAAATHLTPYGPAGIDWKVLDGQLLVTVIIPTGATGDLVLPNGETITLQSGTHSFDRPVIVARTSDSGDFDQHPLDHRASAAPSRETLSPKPLAPITHA